MMDALPARNPTAGAAAAAAARGLLWQSRRRTLRTLYER